MWVLISKVQIAHLDWSILLKIPMFQSNTFQLIDIERVNFKMMGGKKEREKKMSVKNKEKKKRKEKVLHNVSRIEENLICLFCLFFFRKMKNKIHRVRKLAHLRKTNRFNSFIFKFPTIAGLSFNVRPLNLKRLPKKTFVMVISYFNWFQVNRPEHYLSHLFPAFPNIQWNIW